MQVNVFITRQDGALQNSLLVLHMAPTAAIPKEYRQGWRYFATVTTGDQILGNDAIAIETEIARAGVCDCRGEDAGALTLRDGAYPLRGRDKVKPALRRPVRVLQEWAFVRRRILEKIIVG